MKQLLFNHPLRVGVASAILAGGVLGGAVAFADTPSSTPSATPATPGAAAPAPTAKPAKQRRTHVIGKVTNVSSTGGLSNQGTMTVVEPDGHSTTFSLTGSTKAAKYQGQGQKVTKEAPTSIATSEVIEAGLVNRQGGVAARRIIDSGFKAG
ncbi:MAG TPA: hypothetical protein VGF64_09985 [Acidimicrobiales bacterium]